MFQLLEVLKAMKNLLRQLNKSKFVDIHQQQELSKAALEIIQLDLQ